MFLYLFLFSFAYAKMNVMNKTWNFLLMVWNTQYGILDVVGQNGIKKRLWKTRPDTRLPKSRAGGQGPYLRSLDHLGWSSEVKE